MVSIYVYSVLLTFSLLHWMQNCDSYVDLAIILLPIKERHCSDFVFLHKLCTFRVILCYENVTLKCNMYSSYIDLVPWTCSEGQTTHVLMRPLLGYEACDFYCLIWWTTSNSYSNHSKYCLINSIFFLAAYSTLDEAVHDVHYIEFQPVCLQQLKDRQCTKPLHDIQHLWHKAYHFFVTVPSPNFQQVY